MHHRASAARGRVLPDDGRWLPKHAGVMLSQYYIQERQCMYKVTLRCIHETTVTVEKQYYIFLSVCARVPVGVGAHSWACACVHVALLFQHATLMHHIF